MKWINCVLLQLLVALPALALESAATIAQKAAQVNLGFVALSADMTMSIFSAANDANPTVRHYVLKTREGKRGNDKALIDFKSPSSISGTRMLGVGQADKDNEQWLYLPAFSRTRKIAQNSTSSAFVGSDFSFEDLSPLSFDKYDYADLVEEVAYAAAGEATQAALKITRIPRYPNSAYDLQQVWIDQATCRVLKVEGYKKGVLIKSSSFTDFSLHGPYSWPNKISMANVAKNTHTELTTQKVQFGPELALDREFNPELLSD
jgi:hypothetical protein